MMATINGSKVIDPKETASDRVLAIKDWKAIRSAKTMTVSGVDPEGRPVKVTHVTSIDSGPPTIATTVSGRSFILVD